MNYTFIYVITVIVYGIISVVLMEYLEYKFDVLGNITIFHYIKYFKEKHKNKRK